MDDIIIARAIHILSVLFWIGGVAFVTLVVMPSIRGSFAPDDRLAAFHRIEGHFAPQARVWIVLAGASGFWMIHHTQMWDRFSRQRELEIALGWCLWKPGPFSLAIPA